MKITYLDHSGFSIEMGKLLLIFDYYNTTPAGAPGLQGGTITRELVESFERVYFFASHNHYDHFSSQIYSLAAPHVRYILDVHRLAGGSDPRKMEQAARPQGRRTGYGEGRYGGWRPH